jgi:Zn finger protein HypA/HybF involved in hydrogenase expression
MEEFPEIEPGELKIEFTPHENGSVVVELNPMLYSMPGSTKRLCVQTIPVAVTNNCIILEMPSEWNSPFLRTHSTYIVTDREGMLGRTCPACKSYFRTDCFSHLIFCPYCAHRTDNRAFTTENQKRFMVMCIQASNYAATQRVKTTFDLKEAIKRLPNNRPAWIYTETKRQRTFRCEKCNVFYDVLGEYANCPSCGRRNYFLIFSEKMSLLEKDFGEMNSKLDKLKEQSRLDQECKTFLNRCVSEFDSMANDLRDQLLRIPSIPARKSYLKSLNFQRVIKAHESFKSWFGIEILDNFSNDDCTFLDIMFNRRHLVQHTNSRVDQEYLEKTKDTSVELNQTIRVNDQEIRRLILLTKKAAQNLVKGYESIR